MAAVDIPAVLAAHAKWRRGEPGGKRADLRGADLRYANLRGANLGGANLGGADLRDADLRYANLRYANLGGADLWGADLGGADLRDANLRYANLGGADLESARLPGGWAWWQGGAYGPRRRMIRVLRTPDGVTVMAGCIAGTADDVARQLRDDRHPIWVDEVGREAADRALAQALALIDLGVDVIELEAGEA